MNIIHVSSYEELSRKAADIIAAQVILKPDCILGLATGSTPIGTYQNLIKKYQDLKMKKQLKTEHLGKKGAGKAAKFRTFPKI